MKSMMNPTQNYFLNKMNKQEIGKLPDQSEVAFQARQRKIPTLTMKYLVKENVKLEINRCMHSMNMDLTEQMIQEIVDYIWNKILTPVQREEFTKLANSVNNINQNSAKASEDSINRMIQNDAEQVINRPFEASLFVGTEFNSESDIERLIFNPF